MKFEFCDRCGKQISKDKKMKYHTSLYADGIDIFKQNNYVIFRENGDSVDLCTHCRDLLDSTITKFFENASIPKKFIADPNI